MPEYRSAAAVGNHSLANGDTSKGPIRSDASKGNYLSVLERQIETLEANHSR